MNSPIEGMDQLPQAQQQQLMAAIEQMQVRDSLRMYNAIVERCFRDCVDTFRRKDLEGGEEKCVMRCAEKFTKFSARMGMRFGELSAQAEEQMKQLLEQQGK